MKKNKHNIIPLTEMGKWNHIENTIHRVMSFFNYKEIRPSILLSNEIIKKIYRSGDKNKDFGNFISKLYQIDSEEEISLRPDGTVTYLSEFSEAPETDQIKRIYYIGPMFRRNLNNEKLSGQFHQFGAEVLGSSSYIADVEIIRLGMNIFKKFGLSDVCLELSDFGCEKCRPDYIKQLKEFWEESRESLCPECNSAFVKYKANAGSCVNCHEIWQKSPSILKYLCDNCQENFSLIKKALANLMINYTVNPKLDMSFDYYNKIVFKYRAGKAKKSPYIGGGGRYDYLAQSITGKALNAVGMSADIEELFGLLEKKKLFPQSSNPFKVYIMATHNDLEITLLQLVQELHDNEITVVIGRTGPYNRQQNEIALKEGVSSMVVLDDKMIREGKAMINDLVKKHREVINIRDISRNVLRLKKAMTDRN